MMAEAVLVDPQVGLLFPTHVTVYSIAMSIKLALHFIHPSLGDYIDAWKMLCFRLQKDKDKTAIRSHN